MKRRKLLSILLTLAMLLSLLPAVALTAAATNAANLEVASEDQFRLAATNAKSGDRIVLTQDVEVQPKTDQDINAIMILNTGVTIDLNGHELEIVCAFGENQRPNNVLLLADGTCVVSSTEGGGLISGYIGAYGDLTIENAFVSTEDLVQNQNDQNQNGVLTLKSGCSLEVNKAVNWKTGSFKLNNSRLKFAHDAYLQFPGAVELKNGAALVLNVPETSNNVQIHPESPAALKASLDAYCPEYATVTVQNNSSAAAYLLCQYNEGVNPEDKDNQIVFMAKEKSGEDEPSKESFTVTLFAPMSAWDENECAALGVTLNEDKNQGTMAFAPNGKLPVNLTRHDGNIKNLGWVDITDNDTFFNNVDAVLAEAIENKTYMTELPKSTQGDLVFFVCFPQLYDVLLYPNDGVWSEAFVRRYGINEDETDPVRWFFEDHAGGALPAAADITQAGFELAGWIDEDGAFVDAIPATVTENPVYWANWKTEGKLLVTYQSGEGTGYTCSYEVDPDTTLTVLAYDAEELDFKAPSGYKFDQWAYKCGNDTGTLNPGDSYYVVDNDVTFTALWVKDSSGDTPVSYGGGAETYKITVLETTHGTVTPSAKTASPGTKIKLTVAPDSGFALGEISAKGTAGATVELTKNDDGTYSFTMPAQNVEITAAFVPTESLCDGGEGCPLKKYDDLDTKAWYHDGVHYVLENDIMDDLGNGRFGPNDKVTRAVAVTAIWRLEGRPATDFAMTFEDVPADAPYAEAVRWAQSVGIANGYDANTFGPDDTLTREQFAAFFYRYAQLKGMGFIGMWAFRLNFPDAGSISDWAYEAMSWMVMQGIINGMDGILNPQGFATRAQIATMIERFSHL